MPLPQRPRHVIDSRHGKNVSSLYCAKILYRLVHRRLPAGHGESIEISRIITLTADGLGLGDTRASFAAELGRLKVEQLSTLSSIHEQVPTASKEQRAAVRAVCEALDYCHPSHGGSRRLNFGSIARTNRRNGLHWQLYALPSRQLLTA